MPVSIDNADDAPTAWTVLGEYGNFMTTCGVAACVSMALSMTCVIAVGPREIKDPEDKELANWVNTVTAHFLKDNFVVDVPSLSQDQCRR